MSVIPMRVRKVTTRHRQQQGTRRVYAIAFDLDTKRAEQICGSNFTNCYKQIEVVLTEFGFGRKQGSVYFGDEKSDAVSCVMAVQEIDRRYQWFGRVVRDLRMLRVDEDNDLLPALRNDLRFDDGQAASG